MFIFSTARNVLEKIEKQTSVGKRRASCLFCVDSTLGTSYVRGTHTLKKTQRMKKNKKKKLWKLCRDNSELFIMSCLKDNRKVWLFVRHCRSVHTNTIPLFLAQDTLKHTVLVTNFMETTKEKKTDNSLVNDFSLL